jgi:hypothetical protein
MRCSVSVPFCESSIFYRIVLHRPHLMREMTFSATRLSEGSVLLFLVTSEEYRELVKVKEMCRLYRKLSNSYGRQKSHACLWPLVIFILELIILEKFVRRLHQVLLFIKLPGFLKSNPLYRNIHKTFGDA